jgi:hypothetical protein
MSVHLLLSESGKSESERLAVVHVGQFFTVFVEALIGDSESFLYAVGFDLHAPS